MNRERKAKWFEVIQWKHVIVFASVLIFAVVYSVIDSDTDYPQVSLADVPAFAGKPFVEIAENVPVFTDKEAVAHAFEEYAKPDDLGRSGTAYACVAQKLMPQSNIVFTDTTLLKGQQAYTDLIPCQLIDWSLTAETRNERNLIAGTQYLDEEGMRPFEEKVLTHIQRNKPSCSVPHCPNL